MKVETIAFDADDTLWDNQSLFDEAEKKFCKLLSSFATEVEISSVLLDTEKANMENYGYGAKAFTLSLIETAMKVSDKQVSASCIEEIIAIGKHLLTMPVNLLDGVTDTLKKLSGKYRLVVATKGDLLNQQQKLRKSGLSNYFDYVRIMSDKSPDDYGRLAHLLRTSPGKILMVGNSLKSDIYPALKAGMYAAYIPYHTTWQYESADETEDDRLFKISHISQICQLVG